MTSYIFPDPKGLNLYEEVDKIFERILHSSVSVCGFDTESTVSNSFKEGDIKENFVSIIQICIKENHGGTLLEGISDNDFDYTCYIIPIKQLYFKYKSFPKSMKKFFKSKNICKTGADIHADKHKL